MFLLFHALLLFFMGAGFEPNNEKASREEITKRYREADA